MLFATAVNDATCANILNFALNNFPKDASAFHSSLGYEIISRLSRSLSQLYPSDAKPKDFDDRCHDTRMAPSTLEDLSRLLQTSFFEESKVSNRKIAQKSKTSRRTAPARVNTEINDRLYQALGSQVPSTRESAEEMVKWIIDNQKDTLMVSTLSSVIAHYKALLIFHPVLFYPTSPLRDYSACSQRILSREYITTRANGFWDATGNRSKSFIVQHWRPNTGRSSFPIRSRVWTVAYSLLLRLSQRDDTRQGAVS